MSFDDATTSALTERWKSVTSSRTFVNEQHHDIDIGWFVVMALQICLRMVVLPLRAGRQSNPRVPLPIGVTDGQ